MELVTLNQSGYLQIPEMIRQQLGLNNESKLSLEVQDGKLILKPIKEEPSLYYEGHVLVSNVELLTDANTIIEELQGDDWDYFSLTNLNQCYEDNEPEYTLDSIKEYNDNYERR